MVKINNTELTKGIVKNAKIEQGLEQVPDELASKVVPVMETNPQLLRTINVIKNQNGAGTIYTTPTDKDFYLTSASLSVTGTGAVSGTGTITAFPKGQASTIMCACLVESVAGAADSNSNTITFPFPILLERGSVIAATSSSLNIKSFVITGYTVEP